MSEQRLSPDGVRMLAAFEGNVSHVYLDQAGKETIGIGHLITDEERLRGAFIMPLQPGQAEALLQLDVALAEGYVHRLVKVPLEQYQFDALVSFTFNLGGGALGSSKLLIRLNQGEYDAVPAELERWCKRKDPRTGALVQDAGLLARRRAEGRVWQNGYAHQAVDEGLRHAALARLGASLDETIGDDLDELRRQDRDEPGEPSA